MLDVPVRTLELMPEVGTTMERLEFALLVTLSRILRMEALIQLKSKLMQLSS